MEGRKGHLIVVPFGMQGHLIPALMLAQRLDAIGFEVTYVCPEKRIHHVMDSARARGCSQGGIRFVNLGHRVPEPEESSRSGHDTYHAAWSLIEENKSFRDELHKFLQQLMCSSSPPCCIVADNLVSCVQDVADELGLPRIVMYPSPAVALAVLFHLKNLLQQGKYPIDTSGESIQVPGIQAMHPKDLSTPTWDTSPKVFQEFYIKIALRIHGAAGIICNTFEALEPEVCYALATNKELNPRQVPFLPAGPILPHQYLRDDIPTPWPVVAEDDEQQVLSWLNKQPKHSVLFISFGSISMASSEQIQNVAAGVEASGHRFLWVLPASMKADIPHELLQQNRGLFQGWVNQLLVLSHWATGGFLTHSGWNSTMEGISQGVPMVMLPLFAEQRGNARMVQETLKTGIWLTENELSFGPENVKNAVCKIMQEEGPFRERAIAYKHASRNAAKSSDEAMASFILRCSGKERSA